MANFIEISDFAAPELDVYARLTENQLLCRRDPENAMFIAESPMVIERALDAGCVPLSFLMETKHAEGKARDILARCPEDINVYTAELEVLTQLTGFHLTRGMLCAMLRPKLRKVEDVCCGARRIAVLENVMNPTNIGAIFRSAAALGMDAVLLTAEGSDPLYRRAVRVSMERCSRFRGRISAKTGWDSLIRSASRRPQWRLRINRCRYTIPLRRRSLSLPLCSARRATGLHRKPLPAVTTLCAYRCRTALTR